MAVHTTHENVPKSHPRVAHHHYYWFNDSLAGIDWAHKKKYKFIDQDGHAVPAENTLGFEVDIKHWGLPKKDKFLWIKTGMKKVRGKMVEKRRRLGRKELKKSQEQWGWTNLQKLRTSRSGKSGLYLSVRKHMERCAHWGITMCLEAKGSILFEQKKVWDYVRLVSHQTGCDLIMMTLMKGPTSAERARRRCAAAHAAGVPTVLLVHGWKKPADWEERWAMHVDAVWGWWAK